MLNPGPTKATALAAGCAALLLTACSKHDELQAAHQPAIAQAALPGGSDGAAAILVDRALQPWQVELLELAFRSASAMPMEPHRKNRANAQQTVVDACLQLEQPARALRCLEQINGWQKGACYAELAWHCARHGNQAPVAGMLDLAMQLADQSLGEDAGQEWRRDRIRAKVARTRILLGQAKEALALEAGLADSELGETAAAKASQLDPAAFDLQLQALDEVFASQNFDQIKGAMLMCVRLYERFHDDAARRAQLELRVKSAYPKMPVAARLEYLVDVIEIAARHGNRLDATALVDHSVRLLDGITMLPEDRLPVLARLAELRGRAGDLDGARAQVEAALELFQGKRAVIADVFRGAALRPLAEALHSFGDDAKALGTYRLVVEEGLHNPNSRPRAEDLAATCLSMAVRGCEPDAALRQRMTDICGALGNPW